MEQRQRDGGKFFWVLFSLFSEFFLFFSLILRVYLSKNTFQSTKLEVVRSVLLKEARRKTYIKKLWKKRKEINDHSLKPRIGCP